MFTLGFDTHIMASDVIVPLARERHRTGQAESLLLVRPSMRSATGTEASSKDSIAYTYIHFWALAYRRCFLKRRSPDSRLTSGED